MRIVIVALCLVVFTGSQAVARESEGRDVSAAVKACAPDAWLPYFGEFANPAEIQPGLGGIHYAVSTKSAQAQLWFDQGLNLLYGFAHEDAIRSFEAALRYDPRLAMAYWGIAYAYGDNINLGLDTHRGKLAWDALHSAERLSSTSTGHERGLISALSVRYAGPPCYGTQSTTRAQLARAYYDRMQALHAKYPGDEQIATLTAEAGLDLYPWAQWTRRGLPTSPVTTQVVELLRSVLAAHPDHIGALHFYIHAVEASSHPEDGLAGAQRIKRIAWGQPHLVHAASHIYARIGDWNAAMISGEDALAQDRLYAIRIGKPDLYSLAHSNHNRHFQASVLSMGGRMRETMLIAKALTTDDRPFVTAVPPLEFYLPVEQLLLVRFRQWDRVLAYPDPSLPQQFLAAPALWHYSRAMAYFGQGENTRADRELRSLDAFLAAIQPRAGSYEFNFNKAADVLTLASMVAHAREAYALGNLGLAETRYVKAVSLEDHLKYDEPPPWYFPIRESLGAVQLKRNEAARAEATFRDDLLEFPRNGRSLYGLMLALRRQGKDTADVRKQFEDAWSAADSTLTLDSLI